MRNTRVSRTFSVRTTRLTPRAATAAGGSAPKDGRGLGSNVAANHDRKALPRAHGSERFYASALALMLAASLGAGCESEPFVDLFPESETHSGAATEAGVSLPSEDGGGGDPARSQETEHSSADSGSPGNSSGSGLPSSVESTSPPSSSPEADLSEQTTGSPSERPSWPPVASSLDGTIAATRDATTSEASGVATSGFATADASTSESGIDGTETASGGAPSSAMELTTMGVLESLPTSAEPNEGSESLTVAPETDASIEPIATCGDGISTPGEQCCTDEVITAELDGRSAAVAGALDATYACTAPLGGTTGDGRRLSYEYCVGTCENGNAGCDTTMNHTDVVYEPATRTVYGVTDVTLVGTLNWRYPASRDTCDATVSLPEVEFIADVQWTGDPLRLVVTVTNVEVDVVDARVSGCFPRRPPRRAVADMDLAAVLEPLVSAALAEELAGPLGCPY